MFQINSISKLSHFQSQDLKSFLSSDQDSTFIYQKPERISYSVVTYKDGERKERNQLLNIPELKILKALNVTILGKGAVIKDSDIIEESLQNWITKENANENSKFIENKYCLKSQSNGTWSLVSAGEKLVIDEPTVILATASDNEFFHFIFETLSKVHVLKEHLDSFKWIVNDNKPYQIEMLLLAGIKKENIVVKFKNDLITCKSAIIIQPPANNNHWATPSSINYLRDVFNLNTTTSSMAEQKKNYWLVKPDEFNGKMPLINSSIIDYFLHDSGFNKIEASNNNILQCIEQISKANILIGDYRAGLQLSFAASPGTRIVNLQSPNAFRNFNHYLSSILSTETISIIGNVRQISDKRPNADYTVRPIDTLSF